MRVEYNEVICFSWSKDPGTWWPPRDWVPVPMRYRTSRLGFSLFSLLQPFSTNLRLQTRPPYKLSRQTIPIRQLLLCLSLSVGGYQREG